MDFKNHTITTFNKGLAQKDFSAREACDSFLHTLEEKDSLVHAYLASYEAQARSCADDIDMRIAREEKISLCAGVPCAIKDNILIEGTVTTAASQILKSYVASYDATAIQKLKKEHVVFLGKTNLDEFAMGVSTENSAFGVTKNPWDTSRVPGGSSGGSAAAVASGMAFAALGSDTGGSIRQPAAFCGVVGLKPTYGAVSRSGLIAMASSLDQIGPITKTVEDAQILFNVLQGKDPMDSTTVESSYQGLSGEKIKHCTIGIPKEYFIEGLSDDVKKGMEIALRKLKDLGFRCKEISLPHTKYAVSVYYIVMPAEVSANLARFDGMRYERNLKSDLSVNKLNLKELYLKTRGDGFGEEVKRRILLGTYVLSSGYYDAYYAKAQKVRQLIKEDFDRAFDPADGGVDVIFAPTTPTSAFKIGEKSNDPLQMYLADVFTCPINLAGLPAISIPVESYTRASYSPTNLPVGFQLIGKRFHENDILEIGKLYEK